jgi:hypothetical protein
MDCMQRLLAILFVALASVSGLAQDLPTGAIKRFVVTEDGEGTLGCLAFSPDGKTLACGGSAKKIHLFDVASGELLRSFGTHVDSVWTVAWSPDGRMLCSGGRADLTLRAWNPATGDELAPFEGHQGGITRIRFFRDGKRLIMSGGSWDPTIRIWSVAERKQLMSISAHSDLIDSMDLAASGRLAISGSRDGQLRIWDLRRGSETFHYSHPGDDAGFSSVAFSPDGRLFAFGTFDGQFEIRETLTGRRCMPALEHNGAVRYIAFSPDGRLVAFVGDTRQLVVWDAWAGSEIARFRGHTGPIQAVAFSPDGKQIATSGADAHIFLWQSPGAGSQSRLLTDDERLHSFSLLTSDNAVIAHRAIVDLANDSGPVVALLANHVAPAVAGDEKAYAKDIAMLGSPRYSERETAMRDLELAGDLAEGAIRRALADSQSLEQRHRLVRLLDRIDHLIPTGAALRSLRLVAILEMRRGDQSRELLTKLASGAPTSRLTIEAHDSLDRLRP